MGTHVFFEKDESVAVDPLYCKCESYYKYIDKTNKVMRMTRILAKECCEMQNKSAKDGDDDSEVQLLKTSRTYQEALNLLLPPGKDPPRTIPEEENGLHLLTMDLKRQKMRKN